MRLHGDIDSLQLLHGFQTVRTHADRALVFYGFSATGDVVPASKPIGRDERRGAVPQISNLDHVVLQLRRQLADRAKREGTRSPTSSPAKTSSEPMPLMGTVGGQASAVKEAGGESR